MTSSTWKRESTPAGSGIWGAASLSCMNFSTQQAASKITTTGQGHSYCIGAHQVVSREYGIYMLAPIEVPCVC